MSSCFFYSAGPVACTECDWKGDADAGEPIADVQERLTAGDVIEIPCCQCPECGSLCMIVRPPAELDKFLASERLRERADEVLAILKRAVPWLARAQVEGVHLTCAMPNDLVRTLQRAEAILKQIEGN